MVRVRVIQDRYSFEVEHPTQEILSVEQQEK
jgi:hypothetical protein